MEVIARSQFYKDAKKCPEYVQQQTNDVIYILESAKNLQAFGLDYEKVKDQRKGENYYRIRIGDWRMGIA